jgi:hypothetical protein
MQSKGGMLNVFTGVLVEEDDPLNDAEWEALRQQLLDEEEGDHSPDDDDGDDAAGFTPTLVPSFAFACLVYLAPGALIGVLEATIFLAWLDAAPTLGTAASIGSSIFWSFMTAFVSYVCFRLFKCLFKTAVCKVKNRSDDDTILYCCVGEPTPAADDEDKAEDEEPNEYYFCVGVFVGFCAMCMTHDILQGFPIRDVLILTGLPAVAFALLMLLCASRKRRCTLLSTATLPNTRPVKLTTD